MTLKNTQAIQCILFDLDGTLLNTCGDFVVVFNKLLKKYGYEKKIDEAFMTPYLSLGSKSLLHHILKENATSEKINATLEEFLHYYTEEINDPERSHAPYLYDGMALLLEKIKQRGIPWGVVTNKPERFARPILAQAELLDECCAIVCPDHVEKPKPDPAALLLACQMSQCDPNYTIFIGDHERDIVAGRKAGMYTIGVRYGFLAPEDCPENWEANHLIDHPNEIHEWLESQQWHLYKHRYVGEPT